MRIDKKILKYVLMTFLVCGIAVITYADDLDDARDELDKMESEYEKTKDFIESIQGLKEDEEAYVKELDKKLEEYALEVYDIGLKIEAKEEEIANKEEEIIAKEEEIVLAEEDIIKQYEDMKLRIQYMYENGEISDLQMLFDSENMADMLSRAEYINQITEYDREMLVKLKNSKEALEGHKEELLAQKEDLEAQKTELLALKESAEAKYASTEQLIADKQTVINSYEGQLNESQMTAEEIEKEIAAQEQLIAELEEIERQRELASTQIMYDGGKMRWPLPGYYRLSDDYGMRNDPFGGPGQKMHNGIDIPAPAGTPIIAAYDGQVAWSYYNWSAGNWIGIDHGDGIYTVYMHMSAMLVSEGEYVKAGDTIGLVGTTGSSTGNHLHFAVRLDGSYVNPHDYVTTAY